MCVEIDLEKPLISRFQLKRKVGKIEYEGIHLVCFSSGRFNHQKDKCSSKQKTTPPKLEGSRTGDREDNK